MSIAIKYIYFSQTYNKKGIQQDLSNLTKYAII